MGLNNIDISNYVAIGDSITSGYTDGALFYEGQLICYPSLLSQQLKKIGGGKFKQALMDKDSVGIGFFANSRMVLKRDESIKDSNFYRLAFLSSQGDLKAFQKNIYSEKDPFNNLGVPGLKAITALMPGYGNPHNGEGNYNPFFYRIASNPQSSSVLLDAIKVNPSFFTLFLGNNDVLAYALSGGTQDFITPSFAHEYEVNFEDSINTIINELTKNGAKGAIANISDIRSVPFFTTIPYNGLRINATKAAQLNKKYANDNLHFIDGDNPFVYETTDGVKQLVDGELILMEVLLDSRKNDFLSAEKPIPKKYILTNSQIKRIQLSIYEYNLILESVAKSKHLAFVDVNSLIKKVDLDREYNAKNYSLQYLEPSVFSLDGIHLNSLGQAILTNAFIQAINSTYGLTIPELKLIKYRKKNKSK